LRRVRTEAVRRDSDGGRDAEPRLLKALMVGVGVVGALGFCLLAALGRTSNEWTLIFAVWLGVVVAYLLSHLRE
jgi:hypothetical protein